ncbi:MAG: class I adenylate-forming enzyme family protein [bacterium]
MVLTSRYTSRPIPDTSLAAYFREAVAGRAAEVAVVDGPTGRTITFGELLDRSASFAHALIARGVAPGDRVAFVVPNLPEVAIAYHGVIAAGAVAMMVNPLSTADELPKYFGVGSPRLVVTVPPLVEAIRVAAPGLPVIALGEAPGAEPFASLLGGSNVPPQVAVSPDAVAVMPYSSGTTGFPKGVMLTHRNMLTACASISEYLRIVEDEVILCALPLAFDYGLYQMIMAFANGARLVLERSFAFPADVLKTMIDEQVTGFPGVPTMFAVLAGMKSLRALDLSRIRYVTNTAAALPVRHITMLRELFPDARIYSMYGLTECKRCTYLPPEDIDRKPESVGIAIPNTELWLVDEHDRKLGPGEIGQLVIRGATVMKGYWEKPEATARKLRPGPGPGEQVLYTGDLCRIDDEGYLYFVGRMDDIIKSRGEKVAPKEVESALVDILGVREAAVIGVADDLLGQAVKAFVVLDRPQGARLDARAIQRECQARLESFMVPKHVEIVDSLPRGATGKIDKKDLR